MMHLNIILPPTTRLLEVVYFLKVLTITYTHTTTGQQLKLINIIHYNSVPLLLITIHHYHYHSLSFSITINFIHYYSVQTTIIITQHYYQSHLGCLFVLWFCILARDMASSYHEVS
jgi:hypothetical protein